MHFCFAKREDTPEILEFIKGLAEYENMLDQVVADVPTLSTGCLTKRRPK